MPELKRSYPQVNNGGSVSYGGSQMLSERETIRKCACGPVAALDLLLYLSGESSDTPISLDRYNEELERFIRRYFPLLPPSGINGITLVAGLNILFIKRKLPYRC